MGTERYAFVSASGKRTEYEVVGAFDPTGDTPHTDASSNEVRLRNPETGKCAYVYRRWLDEGRKTVASGYWERA